MKYRARADAAIKKAHVLWSGLVDDTRMRVVVVPVTDVEGVITYVDIVTETASGDALGNTSWTYGLVEQTSAKALAQACALLATILQVSEEPPEEAPEAPAPEVPVSEVPKKIKIKNVKTEVTLPDDPVPPKD